jgi:hypothetical protein
MAISFSSLLFFLHCMLADVMGGVANSKKTKKNHGLLYLYSGVGWRSTWPGACTPASTLDLMKFSTFSKREETIRKLFC